LQAIFGGFMREAQQTPSSLLHLWIFALKRDKVLAGSTETEVSGQFYYNFMV
jgi:hypothetical protein